MSKKRYPPSTIYYGHGINCPDSAPAQSAERVTNVSATDLDHFLALLDGDGTLTFDDGYLDNLTNALPILEKHDRSATVFITCGFIDGSQAPLERVAGAVARAGPAATAVLARLNVTAMDANVRYDHLCARLKPLSVAERQDKMNDLMAACGLSHRCLTADYLDIKQLRELASHPLITIGAHTLTHPDLRYASNQELAAEMDGARSQIQAWIDRPVLELAYPYGDTDLRVRRAAAQAGYHRAYVVEQANWRSRIAGYRRLDIPRVDLSTAIRRMRKQQRKAADQADMARK